MTFGALGGIVVSQRETGTIAPPATSRAIFALNAGRVSRDTELPPHFSRRRESLPKSVAGIRKILRKLTGLTTDPIRWCRRESGYVCEFVIADRRQGG